MARTDNLTNFLTDVAESIRTKEGTTEQISASEFDTRIANLSGGDVSEYFETTVYHDAVSNFCFANELVTKIPEDTEIKLDYVGGYDSAIYLFCGMKRIKTIPQLDTSNVNNMQHMFDGCYSLTTIPQLDTSNVKNMNHMFIGCSNLTEIPHFDTSNVTTMIYMFYNCYKITEIPQFNTSNVTDVESMFYNCINLIHIPLLDFGNISTLESEFHSTFGGCTDLITLGGFKDLGKNYSSKTSNNYPTLRLKLKDCSKLTHDSLMNVINNLYDLNLTYNVANGGTLYTQQLVLGSTNLAKLTEDEIAIATAKGWTVS